MSGGNYAAGINDVTQKPIVVFPPGTRDTDKAVAAIVGTDIEVKAKDIATAVYWLIRVFGDECGITLVAPAAMMGEMFVRNNREVTWESWESNGPMSGNREQSADEEQQIRTYLEGARTQ